MKIREYFSRALVLSLVLAMAVPPWVSAQEKSSAGFRQEELDQMLAPIALYPDSLLAQVLMASTYPLEVVQADRWAKQNKGLKGDALTKALEEQSWDPSVKSLVQFPDVLAMMGEKLSWTQSLGDSFLSQREDVTKTVQNLRRKAEAAGNLKSTKEQVVKVEKEVIVIEPASPQVVYVPVYNPTVVYGTWWWPAYPPYYYYPPYYPAPTLLGFATGVAIGAAWGYAWGHWDWHRHSVNVNINQNININRNINRNAYVQHYGGGSGEWRHSPEHRKGVTYRDQNTARQYNRAATPQAVRSRESYRGRTEQGGQPARQDGAKQAKRQDTKQRDVGSMDRGTRDVSGRQSSAFSGIERGGASKDFSNRGSASRSGGSSSGGRGGRR